ncbi:MAG: hypothetical protein ACSHYF_01780 [Verrucomicrobiaceae bacterium]
MQADAVNQWIDAGELRKLAESLMSTPPLPVNDEAECVYGAGFVGYMEAGGDDRNFGNVEVARRSAMETLSAARGMVDSAGLSQAPPMHGESDVQVMEIEPVVTRSPRKEPSQEVTMQPVSSGPIESPFKLAGDSAKTVLPEPVVQRASIQPIESSSTSSGQPLARRMEVFGEWLKRAVPAEAFFVCDRNGEIIADEIGNSKLVKVARTLAHASSSASRQVADVGGLASPHVKIGVDRVLQVVPKRSKFGLVVLGIIVSAPLSREVIEAVISSLSKTLGDEVSVTPK